MCCVGRATGTTQEDTVNYSADQYAAHLTERGATVDASPVDNGWQILFISHGATACGRPHAAAGFKDGRFKVASVAPDSWSPATQTRSLKTLTDALFAGVSA